MKDAYVLKICCDQVNDQKQISRILGVEPSFSSEDWCLEIIEEDLSSEISQGTEEDSSQTKSYITDFLDLLEGKYQQLADIGVDVEDITIWQYYEYDNGQCNMEFHPEVTKRLGDNGIVLCISCWES